MLKKEYLDDNRFYPIITDFKRTSQPIYRYRLNDILVEEKSPCPCGSVLLESRKSKDDRTISSISKKLMEAAKPSIQIFIRRSFYSLKIFRTISDSAGGWIYYHRLESSFRLY